MLKKMISTLAMTAALLTSSATVGYGAGPNHGDATVHAKVPTPPGYPRGSPSSGTGWSWPGRRRSARSGRAPPQVLVYNKTTGALVESYSLKGENLLAEHGNSSVAIDGKGRIYLLNTQLGVVRLTFEGVQHNYSTPFPDLPTCVLSLPGTPCSPTPIDLPPLPNDIAFDDAGNAYVSDSMQATIWRVPPGGALRRSGSRDARLASEYIGVNGLRITPPRPPCTSR